tara:strand:- start:132 stop:506 length:375 start_codon:yes stop_codon:yes gene_type:complete
MIYKVNKLFLKIACSFKLILINILFFSILFLFGESATSSITNIERNLALRYCDSIEKNLFKGLENERRLKYEYFFNSISAEVKNDQLEKLDNFVKEVETICSYKLSIEEKKDMWQMIKKYLTNE